MATIKQIANKIKSTKNALKRLEKQQKVAMKKEAAAKKKAPKRKAAKRKPAKKRRR